MRSRTAVVIAALMALAAQSADVNAQRQEPTGQTGQTGSQTIQLPANETLDLPELQIQTPPPPERGPIWEAVKKSREAGEIDPIEIMYQYQTTAAGAYPKMREKIAELKQKTATVGAPVLLPQEFTREEKTGFIGKKISFSSQSPVNEVVIVTVTGSCAALDPKATPGKAAHEIARLKSKRRMMTRLNAPYEIVESDYGIELNFSKFGCAYSILVTCSAEEGDSRCMTPPRILEMCDRMLIVNEPSSEAGNE